jgi:hypothetical protein
MKREPAQRKRAAAKPAPMSREEAMSLAAAKADAEMTAANAKTSPSWRPRNGCTRVAIAALR